MRPGTTGLSYVCTRARVCVYKTTAACVLTDAERRMAPRSENGSSRDINGSPDGMNVMQKVGERRKWSREEEGLMEAAELGRSTGCALFRSAANQRPWLGQCHRRCCRRMDRDRARSR